MEKTADHSQSLRYLSRTDFTNSWSPASFQRSVLTYTTIATSLLLGCTILLHLSDSRHGAVFESTGGNGLSFSEIFLVRYLPTILLVVYGTWISILDLDIKRLEPWFQLSKPCKSLRDSPLLCRYDTDFVLTVLVRAVSRRYGTSIRGTRSWLIYLRHWIIFGSSLLLLIATVIVPAVQSSMFAVRRQDVQSPVSLSNAAVLADVGTQKFQMTNNLLLSAYAVTWLGQTPPSFCTNEYAIAPFQINNVSAGSFGTDISGTTIRGPTTRYWSDLTCWAPSSVQVNLTSKTVSFDDGRGCEAQNLLSFDVSVNGASDQSAKYEAYQYGIGSFGFNPFLPSLPTECPDKPHLTLATWRTAGPTVPNFTRGGNATAIFCEAIYYSEPVEATIKAIDLSVVTYTPTGPKSEIPDSLFNRTHFEYIISSGSPPRETIQTNITLDVDIADAMYVSQDTKILNMSVITPTQQSKDVMIGFALGTTKFPIDSYLDPDTLSTAYRRAHQLLFVHAIRQTFSSWGGNASVSAENITQLGLSNQSGVLIRQGEIARLVPGFTIATEVLLALVCTLCIYLLVVLPRRQLSLCRNPDSLAETMVLSRAHGVQELFARLSSVSEEYLEGKLQESSFYLDHDSQGPLLTHDQSRRSNTNSDILDILPNNSTPARQNIKHSLELSWTVTSLVGCLLAGSIILLIALSVMIRQQDGLDMFSSSEFSQQVLLNLLPTAAATLLGIHLVLLCRAYSFMKPMYDLLRGNATARSTLLVKYTSLPPQLLFTKALQTQHYLLGMLSIAALLSNVLTVTTASMFVLQGREASVAVELNPDFNPVVIDHTDAATAALGEVTGSSALDPVYPNALNISDNVRLPAWTTTGYGFIPMNLSESSQISKYALETLGYGADLDCTNLLEPSPGVNGNIVFQNNGTTFKVWANFTQPDDNITTCVFDLEYENSVARLRLAQLSSTISALEISNVMKLWNGSLPVRDGFCAARIVKGWLRAKTTDSEQVANSSGLDYNATIVVCKPRLKTMRFSLNMTSGGDIMSAQPIEPANYDLPSSVDLSATFRAAIVSMRDFYHLPQWHNDTIARDWSNYLFQELNGNRDWLNASMPPPSVEQASSVASSIFSRIFAVQLSVDRKKLQPVASANSTNVLKARDGTSNSTTTTNNARAIIPVRKLFMSFPNFIISVSILTFDLIVLIIFRFTLPKAFLPRMPFTIASQIAFFSGSHAIDDVVKAGGDFKELDEKGYRYAYGRYIGKDGWLHTGIERDQFVTKL